MQGQLGHGLYFTLISMTVIFLRKYFDLLFPKKRLNYENAIAVGFSFVYKIFN